MRRCQCCVRVRKVNAFRVPHRAIDENKEALATFLIRSGCDVESPRRVGADGSGADVVADAHAPLHLCCTWGLTDVIQVPHTTDILLFLFPTLRISNKYGSVTTLKQ
jgi:hypothetical protein